jgi:hypothetical protein
MVVNAGKAIITNRLKNGSTGTTEPNFVAMGTGATAEAATQTALVTEVDSSPTRPTGTSTQQTTTTTSDTYQVVGTITATTARAITEAGLFDATTAGNMFMRAVFSVINLATGDSIQFTMKVQFT